MKYRLTKRWILQVLVVFVIVVFAVRESRILWDVEGLEIFDFAYWGVNISDEVYTAQNLFMFWGGIIVLILLRSRREAPEVLSEHALVREKKTPKSSSPRRRKERDKAPDESEDPFGMVNKKWRKVEFEEDTYP